MNIPGKAALAALLLAIPMPTPARPAHPQHDPHDQTHAKTVVVIGDDDGDDGDTFAVEPPLPPDAPEAPRAPLPPRARIHVMRKGSFLGVELVDITPALRALYGAPKDAGVLIGEVEKDSPAAKAGLEVGDVLTAVDGEKITSSWNVSRAVWRKSPGESVEIQVTRKGSSKTLKATVAERSGDEAELRGWARDFGRDFGSDFGRDLGQMGRDIGREVRRGLRGRSWSVDVESPRVAVLSGDAVRKLRERVADLERRLKDLEKKGR
jgi:membrane-associated protease RseP (regulator of RpoE activity)